MIIKTLQLSYPEGRWNRAQKSFILRTNKWSESTCPLHSLRGATLCAVGVPEGCFCILLTSDRVYHAGEKTFACDRARASAIRALLVCENRRFQGEQRFAKMSSHFTKQNVSLKKPCAPASPRQEMGGGGRKEDRRAVCGCNQRSGVIVTSFLGKIYINKPQLSGTWLPLHPSSGPPGPFVRGHHSSSHISFEENRG